MPAGSGGGASIDPVKVLKKYLWLLIGAGIIGGALGIATHFAVLVFHPTYKANVIFEVRGASTTVTEAAGTGNVDEDELTRFMMSQIATMKSEQLLLAAANDPRIATDAPSWAAQFQSGPGGYDYIEAGLALADTVKARVIPGTSFIELQFAWRKKVDTAAVVNIVKDTFRDDLTRRAASSNSGQNEVLRKVVKEIEGRISQLQKNRDRRLVDNEIDSLTDRTSEAGHALQLASEQVSEVRMGIEAYQVQLQSLEAELNSPGGIQYPDDIRAAADATPIISGLKNTIATQEANLGSLRTRFGEGHRDIKTLVALIDGYKRKLEEQRETELRQLFDAKIQGTRSTLQQLRAQEADLLATVAEKKKIVGELTRIASEITDIDAEIARLTIEKTEQEAKLRDLTALGQADFSDRVVVVEDARVPTEVAFPKLIIVLPLVTLMTVGLVATIIVLLELLDQRVRSPADVAVIPRTRVAGMIPHAAEDPAGPAAIERAFVDCPEGVVAESYRQLRAPLLKRLEQAGHKSMVVLSGMPGSGSTSVIANLGAAWAASGRRTLIIDANFRRPKAHAVFGVDVTPGLGDVLKNESDLESAIRPSGIEDLDILTAGTPGTRQAERLDTDAMSDLLTGLSQKYSLVLVDVAPAIVSGDGVALANRCDASLLVARAMADKRGLVARVKNELTDARAEFLGVVVNAVRASAGGYFKRNIKAAHEYRTASSS